MPDNLMRTLAARFPQLYVAPSQEAESAHKLASGYGVAPDGANLDHFIGSDEDELRVVDTPAGPIDVVFLKNRGDFETFLQIIGHKSRPDPIAPTVGAITYRGLADWLAVKNAKRAYLNSGGEDWAGEFSRLAKQPGAFRAELVVISEGPYSNIAASETPYDAEEWLRRSREIRLHHECAHVVCRRTMPDDILPVWDEITADVVGLLCATADYNGTLAAKFLGVSDTGFSSGRLSEYLRDDQLDDIDSISVQVRAAIDSIEKAARSTSAAQRPFDFLVELKENPLVEY